ncbi:MAG TPA: HAD-IA family hydrolase [Solirubrobacteraceae bacterium]|nr:HAD-IA family hydrolase [Solirubrobacteraceae bacterium]
MTVVLSDMDGVLVDSTPAVVRTWEKWGRRLGVDGAAVAAANHGRPGRDVLAQFFSGEELDAEAAAFEAAEVEDTEGVVPMPGAERVLELPRVAIVTSCTRPLALARLAAAGLREPAVLVTADMVARGKPAPDPYLLGAELMGAGPAECIVLEDAPAGIAAGRAAGMTVWAVATTHERGELGGAQRIADGLEEHLAALALRRAA